MTCLHLTGGNPLFGEMKVQGSKNAALPILAASVLCEDEIILENLPDITDIKVFQELLAEAGVSLKKEGKLLFARADQVSPLSGQSETGKKIRSSVLLLGPMLARGLPVDLPYPGGCAIGKRPVDIHLEGLRRMGAEIEEEEERICARPGVLRGIRYHLPFPSVGATQNLIMAGVFAQGETRLTGCAKEPEVEFLCRTLNHLGARIKGGGTDQVVIQGVKKLRGGYVKIPGDRIAAGTFLLYGAACGGMIEVWGFDTAQLESLYPILKKGGCRLIRLFDRVFLCSEGALQSPGEITTAPYPGFPTDLQSIVLSACATARGDTLIREELFENRFQTVPELRKAGADISVTNTGVLVRGVKSLKGARMEVKDLRGGAGLILAALSAEGESVLTHCSYIFRGYENLIPLLRGVGAQITQTKE